MKRIRLVLEIRDDKTKSLKQIANDYKELPDKMCITTALKHSFATLLERIETNEENFCAGHD